MSTMYIMLSGTYIAFTVFFITLILIQKKRSSGMGATMTGNTGDSTYWDKNKGGSIEGKLEKYTVISGIIFFLFTLVMTMI